jgi:chorismate mutase
LTALGLTVRSIRCATTVSGRFDPQICAAPSFLFDHIDLAVEGVAEEVVVFGS